MQTNTRKCTKVQKIFTTLFPRRNFLEKREVVAAESHSILRAVPSRPGDHDDNSDNDDNSNNDDDIYGDDDDGNSDNDDDNSDDDDNGSPAYSHQSKSHHGGVLTVMIMVGICHRRIPTIEYNVDDDNDNEKT